MGNQIKTQISVKVVKRDEKPQHPLYNAFTHQIGATLIIARQIKADMNGSTSNLVQRFLDEFGQKV